MTLLADKQGQGSGQLLREIDEAVLSNLRAPSRRYWVLMLLLAMGIGWAVWVWVYMVKSGMGVNGLNQPVCWAFFVTNFVFWVGIGHAGTLISAILHLVRSRWRTAVARSAEAMTVFAVMTAGLFPLVHLGRLWVFYYIIPYPSERQLWPNFTSPLVWDVVAVSTYLTVSTIFWFVGLIPDLATARDRYTMKYGPDHPRSRLYRRLALGWSGSSSQWHHYGRAYLFFAALATPLVISVHSVVSWDFAMSLLPGWHTTIFAPYFVAGAIHSGLAMVLTLVIPMRKLFGLQRVIRMEHFDAMARTIVATAIIVGYAYFLEPFIAWYSGDRFEQQYALWRAGGWMAVFYWGLFLLNVFIPLVLLFRRARYNLYILFFVGVAINLGMWLERWVIISGSLSHDFMPHNWRTYSPTWVEISITAGGFCFFLFWFFGFSKLAPTVAVGDIKEKDAGYLYQGEEDPGQPRSHEAGKVTVADGGVVAVYASAEALIKALEKVRGTGLSPKENASGMGVSPMRPGGILPPDKSHLALFERVQAFTPFRLNEVSNLLYHRASPVRLWTLTGAALGAVSGFALAIGSAYVNSLVVGAKFTPTSYIPYCIIGFEGLILTGTLFNLAGVLHHCRLGPRRELPKAFDGRFTQDRYGLFIACEPQQGQEARDLLAQTAPEEVHDVA